MYNRQRPGAVHLLAQLASVLLLTSSLSAAHAGLAAVWAVDDGEKIFKDDLSNPLASGGDGNSVWDGTTARLSAARNEVVAFQFILEADGSGADTVNVTVSALTNGANTIRGSHPLLPPNSYVGMGVELFTEHYLHVTEHSYNDPDWGGFYTTAEANPQITGWIPDALIPFSAAAGKGGAPFDIPANSNQGVWADIYVSRDLPAGTYTGAAEVTVGGATAAVMPIELEVLGLTLPDENHYHSMVFYSDYCIRPRHDLTWGSPELWEMILDYHRMAHRHRLELIGSGSWDELTQLEDTLTGDAFIPANGYEGPGEGVGNTLFSIHTYGSSFGATEPEYRTNSDMWVNWFDANAPDVECFLYLIDEPGSDMYAWITERAGWIHNNPGPGSRLPVFVTKWPVPQLVGSVDIWSMQAPWWDPSEIAAAEGRGERAWLYAGNRPQTPMDVTDEYGVALRLKPWIAYKCDIPRWFTWEVTHWYPNGNEVPNDVPKNIFVDPLTFYAGYDGSRGNGDGTMFYPGEDNVFPDQDRQYPGPMSSIRMKMYRRGVQDYEYMWLAEQAGYAQEVGWVLDNVLPDVMWEAPEVPNWSNSNATYEEARADIAALMGPPRAPKAGFSASPTYGSAPLAVDFTDQTIFDPTSWYWDFGDGSTSTDRNPTHTYGNTGTFTVSLTAGNAEGQDAEIKFNHVTAVPPTTESVDTSDTWGTWHGWAEVTVVSGGLGSLGSDDDVYTVAECDGENQRYSMWYTCDTPYAPEQIAKMTIEYQAHSSEPDTPDCLLFVRKSDGSFEHITTRLWSTSDEWFVWETTNLAKYMSTDGVVGFEVCGCPQNGSSYTISVDVLRFRFEVFDPPTAAFSALPTAGVAPLTVSFTDESMYPTAWNWDFGDGGASSERHPSHIYCWPGTHTVTLTAMNGGGQNIETKVDYITVDPAVPPRVVLEVHPKERAPGASDPQFLGWDPWTQPTSSPHNSYMWKKYEFYANGPLWIQVCAQNWAKWQKGYASDDNTWLEVNGVKLADYDGIQNGPPGGWQWVGSKENGQRWTLCFLHLGPPGKQSLWIGADESPALWWVKVTDLEATSP